MTSGIGRPPSSWSPTGLVDDRQRMPLIIRLFPHEFCPLLNNPRRSNQVGGAFYSVYTLPVDLDSYSTRGVVDRYCLKHCVAVMSKASKPQEILLFLSISSVSVSQRNRMFCFQGELLHSPFGWCSSVQAMSIMRKRLWEHFQNHHPRSPIARFVPGPTVYQIASSLSLFPPKHMLMADITSGYCRFYNCSPLRARRVEKCQIVLQSRFSPWSSSSRF